MESDSRRETAAAALGSVLVHLLIVVCIALAMSLPAWNPPPSPLAEEAPIEVTMIAEAPRKPAAPEFVRTVPQNVAEAPKNAAFESDNNTRAASDSAPTGGAAVPSVDGRESPAVELESRNYAAGAQAQASAPAPESAAQPEAAAPASTPTAQLALREAPKPETQKRPADRAQPEAAKPKPAAASGFQPETRVTRIRGNISNRGRASVDAAATPLGRYKKMVSDAIGSRWYYYVNNQIGLLNIGTVDIRFQVGPDGKAQKVKVLSNTSNESFASVSISSIIEAEIPPIPPEVVKLLDNGRLEIDYSFTILSN